MSTPWCIELHQDSILIFNKGVKVFVCKYQHPIFFFDLCAITFVVVVIILIVTLIITVSLFYHFIILAPRYYKKLR
uniref:Uncharacterized protein n=1 Tax=Anguilla anguilla TaxID=7936 RepID=A0A0E9TMS3_ANGAN